jgi:hypothetical protein
MHRKMVECGSEWSVPFDFKGSVGVLFAKAGPDKLAIYEDGKWHVMDQAAWEAEYKDPFPVMCPWGPDSAGWCILHTELLKHNGRVVCYPLTPEQLSYALEEQAEELFGFFTDRLRAVKDEERRLRQLREEFRSQPYAQREVIRPVVVLYEPTPRYEGPRASGSRGTQGVMNRRIPIR